MNHRKSFLILSRLLDVVKTKKFSADFDFLKVF